MIIVLFLLLLVCLWFYFVGRFIRSTNRLHELRERKELEDEIMRSAYYGFDSYDKDNLYMDDFDDDY